MTFKAKKRKMADKIFDNTFNTGELEFEFFDKFELNKDYVDTYLDSEYNAQDYYRNHELVNDLDALFKESKYYDKYMGKKQKKKIPKKELPKIFNFLLAMHKDRTYSHIEFFSGVCSFLDVSYASLFEASPSIFKEDLLKELDEKFQIFTRYKDKVSDILLKANTRNETDEDEPGEDDEANPLVKFLNLL